MPGLGAAFKHSQQQSQDMPTDLRKSSGPSSPHEEQEDLTMGKVPVKTELLEEEKPENATQESTAAEHAEMEAEPEPEPLPLEVRIKEERVDEDQEQEQEQQQEEQQQLQHQQASQADAITRRSPSPPLSSVRRSPPLNQRHLHAPHPHSSAMLGYPRWCSPCNQQPACMPNARPAHSRIWISCRHPDSCLRRCRIGMTSLRRDSH